MDSLSRDVVELIFDWYQRCTQRAYTLSAVSKRWATILSNRTRYPPLLRRKVIFFPLGAHSQTDDLGSPYCSSHGEGTHKAPTH